MNPDDYETLPTDNVGVHMTAGAIAGVMEHCIMYPLDSVKTRMQSLTAGADGISDTFVKMVRQEGVLRPIRGMSAVVLGAGPAHALSFSSYEYLKERGKEYVSPSYYTAVYGASGCVSSLLHDGVMNPAEVVKQRMQMSNSPYRSVLSCIADTYGREGLRAFYRSYVTQLTMNVPFQSIHFMVYEFMQKLTNEERKYNPAAHMVSGAMAGAVAASITTPLDVCKTLLNTQQNTQAQTLIQAIRIIYRINGPAGYFRGWGARVMYQMPSTAICWSTYEFFKYLLKHTPEVRIVPASTVLAETKTDSSSVPPKEPSSMVEPVSSFGEKSSLGDKSEKSYKPRDTAGIPRELPAMSGAGLYGSISFNTMHNNRQKELTSDIIHTYVTKNN